MTFKAGDRVRINDTAFAGTNSFNLPKLRGKEGVLLRRSDTDDVDWWIVDCQGDERYLMESEFHLLPSRLALSYTEDDVEFDDSKELDAPEASASEPTESDPSEPELSNAALIAEILSSPIIKPAAEKPHRTIWLSGDELVIWRGNRRRAYHIHNRHEVSRWSVRRLNAALQKFEMVVNLQENFGTTIHFYPK